MEFKGPIKSQGFLEFINQLLSPPAALLPTLLPQHFFLESKKTLHVLKLEQVHVFPDTVF